MSEHIFKLSRVKEMVTLETAEGQTEQFEIFEMTAAIRDVYLDTLTQRVTLDPSGRPTSVKKFKGMQADLLVLCLKRKNGVELTVDEIQGWPSSVVAQLYELAQRVNQLSKTDETPKND